MCHFALSVSYLNSFWKSLFGCSKIHVPENAKAVALPSNGRPDVGVGCAVCLGEIEAGEESRELRCEHLFHGKCLDRWVGYSRHQTCPLCRGSLDPNKWVNEVGEVVLLFNFSGVRSSDGKTWWLR